MTRTEMITELMHEYARQRDKNEEQLTQRTEMIEAKDPEIARLRRESALLAVTTLRRISKMESREERQACAEDMREQGKAYTDEIHARLRKMGYAENALSLQYRCNLCRDTGLVGEAPARFCDCFEQRLHAMQFEDGSMAAVNEENFGHFDLNVFPEAEGQREHMEKVRRFCENYANKLPNTERESLIITGEGGLGKTFLLNCIYARAVERDLVAIRTSAFRLNEAMRKRHMMHSEEEERAFDDLLEVPVLLIDDLGSEPVLRNVTVEYLFLLLNERAANHRNTIIATNLTPSQLKERYGERVTSRLFDKKRVTAIRLSGADIRRSV